MCDQAAIDALTKVLEQVTLKKPRSQKFPLLTADIAGEKTHLSVIGTLLYKRRLKIMLTCPLLRL